MTVALRAHDQETQLWLQDVASAACEMTEMTSCVFMYSALLKPPDSTPQTRGDLPLPFIEAMAPMKAMKDRCWASSLAIWNPNVSILLCSCARC